MAKRNPEGRGYRGAGLAVLILAAAVGALFFLEDEAPEPEPVPAEPLHAEVPPFHATAERARPFPALMDPARYQVPVVAEAYRIAREIPEVLAQQPCYCHCSEPFGHESLLDCFASDHGATWAICLKEVFLARRMTEAGRSPSQVREAIVAGAWNEIVLEDVR